MKVVAIIFAIGAAIYGLFYIGAMAAVTLDIWMDFPSRREKKKEKEESRRLNDARIAWAAACDYYNELTEESKNRAGTDSMNMINDTAIENARIAMLNAQTAYEDLMRTTQEGMNAMEEARLAATGIEFGGYNPDPNLNPGMSFAMQETYNDDPGWSNSFDSGMDSFSNDSFGGWDNSFNSFF